MEQSVYHSEAELEQRHWWFEGRRRLFARLLKQKNIATDAVILDAGSGTGSNLRMLVDQGFLNIVGLDASPEAIRYCLQKKLPPVHQGFLTALPFPTAHFDLVLATDVLEHLDDDRAGCAEIVRVLRPGGQVLITVPAFESLWGPQDDLSHHKRRYLLPEIARVLKDCGLLVRHAYYFNYLLFPAIWLGRKLLNLMKLQLRSEADINARILNNFLLWIFDLDTRSAPWLKPRFGVSILIWAEAPNLESNHPRIPE